MARPAGFTVQSEGTKPRDMARFLKELKGANGRALDAGLQRCCNVARAEVRRAYMSGGRVEAPKADTLKKRNIVGKLEGKWPAVPTFAGTKPLWRAGLLGRAVDFVKLSTYRYIVGVEGGIPVPYGKGGARTLDQLAIMHETGWSRTFQVTRRMRAYLMILFGESTGVKGPGGRMQGPEGDELTGATITTHIPARPIWQAAFDAHAEGKFFDAFVQGFYRGLRSRLGARIDEGVAAPSLD